LARNDGREGSIVVNSRARNGKSSELFVAGELIRHGLDVYLPLVDDQAIDMIIRTPLGNTLRHYDVQVKSVAGYNRIVGLRDIEKKSETHILIIHYRHATKPDECLYLLREQVLQYHNPKYEWGDLIFNKPDRERHIAQSLEALAASIKADTLITSGQTA
jgi:lipopolysaccharide biosynthesis glycosyltransferase